MPLFGFCSRLSCHKDRSEPGTPPSFSTRLLVPPCSFLPVQVPYTKTQFQRFRVVHWTVQIRFHSYLLLQPQSFSKCPPSFNVGSSLNAAGFGGISGKCTDGVNWKRTCTRKEVRGSQRGRRKIKRRGSSRGNAVPTVRLQ